MLKKKQKTNCETARNFSIVKALEKLGHFPKKESEKEAWFLSPFRSETQASFKVSKKFNRWYDHGKGIGGNVIDLVCLIFDCSVQDALNFLNDDVSYFSFHQQAIFVKKEDVISIIEVKEIKHPALIQYLYSRNISLSIAKTYCKEVWYSYKGSQFFAIGLNNKNSGWELRNKFFKNSSSPKSYAYFKKNSTQLVILEGMFDLLSLAVLNETLLNTSDIIVLKSIAFIKDMEYYLNSYNQVHLYLDKDTAGRKATQYLMITYNNVIDHSYIYKNHKDLNELVCYERR